VRLRLVARAWSGAEIPDEGALVLRYRAPIRARIAACLCPVCAVHAVERPVEVLGEALGRVGSERPCPAASRGLDSCVGCFEEGLSPLSDSVALGTLQSQGGRWWRAG
jgi:hypothetical protein